MGTHLLAPPRSRLTSVLANEGVHWIRRWWSLQGSYRLNVGRIWSKSRLLLEITTAPKWLLLRHVLSRRSQFASSSVPRMYR